MNLVDLESNKTEGFSSKIYCSNRIDGDSSSSPHEDNVRISPENAVPVEEVESVVKEPDVSDFVTEQQFKERLDEDDVDVNAQTENKASEETFGDFRETDKVTDSDTHKGTSVPNVQVITCNPEIQNDDIFFHKVTKRTTVQALKSLWNGKLQKLPSTNPTLIAKATWTDSL